MNKKLGSTSADSRAMEDYLKAIHEISQQTENGLATNGELATHLGLTPGTVTVMVKRLAEMSLVEHQPYYGARLTHAGAILAQRVVHRHDVLQRLLTTTFGLPMDQVAEETERLEHAASDRLVERISQFLGRAA